MGPVAGRRERSAATRGVVSGAPYDLDRRSPRCEPAPDQRAPGGAPDRAPAAHGLGSRSPPAEREEPAPSLGGALRRVPEVPPALGPPERAAGHALPQLRRRVRRGLGRVGLCVGIRRRGGERSKDAIPAPPAFKWSFGAGSFDS